MSKAEELAEWLEFDDERCLSNSSHLRGAAAELRRLAALEKAIMDAEPVKFLVSDPDEPDLGDWVVDEPLGSGFTNIPLYTLNGIKP